jgi:thymidylate synthase
MQLLAGVSDPELMLVVQSRFSKFMDGSAFHGAYGPRVRWQLPEIETMLRQDHTTRQALVEIWDPRYDKATSTPPKDLPCTRGFQFFIRDNTLEMETLMRSNDVWWGASYDWAQFTALQMTMANVLGLKSGRYYHHVGSLHVYARNSGELDYLHKTDSKTRPLDLPVGIGDNSMTWLDVQEQARFILDVASNRVSGSVNWNAFTPSERWYLTHLCAATNVECSW